VQRGLSLDYDIWLLFVPTDTHIYIKTLNYITNAPTCFAVSAPSPGSFDIAFDESYKILKLLKLHERVGLV